MAFKYGQCLLYENHILCYQASEDGDGTPIILSEFPCDKVLPLKIAVSDWSDKINDIRKLHPEVKYITCCSADLFEDASLFLTYKKLKKIYGKI